MRNVFSSAPCPAAINTQRVLAILHSVRRFFSLVSAITQQLFGLLLFYLLYYLVVYSCSASIKNCTKPTFNRANIQRSRQQSCPWFWVNVLKFLKIQWILKSGRDVHCRSSWAQMMNRRRNGQFKFYTRPCALVYCVRWTLLLHIVIWPIDSWHFQWLWMTLKVTCRFTSLFKRNLSNICTTFLQGFNWHSAVPRRQRSFLYFKGCIHIMVHWNCTVPPTCKML